MSKKLWQKNWQLNAIVEAFETKGDLEFDQKLVKADVVGSIAHAAGLKKIGLLSQQEFLKLKQGLKAIAALDKQQKFKLKPGDEDIHSKIENFLTAKYGTVGKKIHTGRSRNDQVLTALRLYNKEKMLFVGVAAIELAEALKSFANKYKNVSMPGYTHMQKAMPSTVGLWAGAIAAGLIDDLELLDEAYELNNQSPLGSAAGYGSPLNLPTKFTAKLMGFERVQNNPIYCQNSRGKIEAAIVSALIALLSEVNRLASDVLLFTTSEFNFFSIASELCSGSSIMPQKKNVDVCELLRSKVPLLVGNYVQLVGLSSNLPSGYNRDLQDTKKPLFESLEIAEDSLRIATIVVKSIKPNVAVLKKAMMPELFATQRAFDLVKQGVPFREAYQQAAKDLVDGKIKVGKVKIDSSYLGLSKLNRSLTGLKREWTTESKKFNQIINHLLK